MTVQVGSQRVGVRAETPELGALVRERFAGLLTGAKAPAAFSLRGEPADGDRRGARPLTLLYWGSCIVGRAAEPARVLDTLAGWFARIEALQTWDGPTLQARWFERDGDDGAVLVVDLPAPSLVDDRRLAARGVREVPGERVPVRLDVTLVVGGRPVRGVVVVDPIGSPGRALMRLMALTAPDTPGAFARYAGLVADGSVRTVAGVDEARGALLELLG